MKERNFERELPSGYRQAKYINAKETKFGIIFNLIALVVLVLVMAIAIIPLQRAGRLTMEIFNVGQAGLLIAYAVFFGSMLAYIVLHELVHGAAYKALTGEKLTFGLSWSCAFCGVPHIYTYRKCALISVLAPFVVFTLIFLPLVIALYSVSPLYYLIFAFLLGMHIGGCSGDLYVTYLLTAKYRGKDTLMRDTGPEQFFYVKDN